MLLTTAVGLLIGVIVRTAQLDGAGRHQACGEVWRLGLVMALLAGAAYAAQSPRPASAASAGRAG